MCAIMQGVKCYIACTVQKNQKDSICYRHIDSATKNLKIPDPHSIVNEVFKRKLNLHLLEEQKSGEQQHWNDKNIT